MHTRGQDADHEPISATGLFVRATFPSRATGHQPLLLIHGAANASGVWFRWMEALSGLGWPVYALDLRGHGRSVLPGGELERVTMEDYVRDVEMVSAWLPGTPVLVGWSMGGLIAQMYVASHPQVPALVLLAPSPPGAVQRNATEKEIASIPDILGPEAYGIDTTGPSTSSALQELPQEAVKQILPELGLESGLARLQRVRGVRVLRQSVRCPVLVVYGEADGQFPPAVCRRVAAYYDAETVVAPGRVGHWGIVAGTVVGELALKADEWLRRRLPP